MTTLKLQGKLKVGRFLRRLNRFMVEVEFQGSKVLAHLPNSGRLVTVLVPDATAILKEKRSARRLSDYDLFAVENSGVLIIVDTRFGTVAGSKSHPARLIQDVEWLLYCSPERKSESFSTRFASAARCQAVFLEIKSVTHVVDGVAMFPDAPTLRGRKHVKTLMRLVEHGFDAGILFSVQRPDAKSIILYHKMDPLFTQLLREATRKGVKVFTQTLTFKPSNNVKIKTNQPVFSFD